MHLSKDIFIRLKDSVPFFSSFSAGELLALLKLASSESFEDGEVIFKERTHGDKMYIILTGAVRIAKSLGTKREETLVTLSPGACFGEMGVIDQSPRSASAVVSGGGAVMLVIRESTLSERNMLLAYKLYKNFAIMLAGRLRETNEKLQDASVSGHDSKEQLKKLLKKKTEVGQSSLEGADLQGADFSGAFLNNANLQDSILIGAKLEGTKCKETDFSGAKFVNSTVHSVTFEKANFENCDFTASNFENVTFDDCIMNGAKFLGANLTEAQLDRIKIIPETKKRKK